MSIRVILPLRSIQHGKRRLAPVLSDDQRCRLILSLFLRTLETAASVVGRDRLLVVSPSEEVLAIAAEHGAAVVRERGEGGLNVALRQAALVVHEANARAALTLSCDLPLLTADDLGAMLATGEQASVVIAPDGSGTGTNALFTAPPGMIDYRFGQDSLKAHVAAAEAVGASPVILRRDGLGCDLDTPADLETLRTQHGWMLPSS